MYNKKIIYKQETSFIYVFKELAIKTDIFQSCSVIDPLTQNKSNTIRF